MKIAQRALRAQPFHAMSIGARARELESRGIRIAKLSLGEPSFGAPPGVHEAMRATMDGRALPYTPAAGLPALRRAVAGLYRTRHGVDVDPRRVLITAGASAGLLLASVDQEAEDVLLGITRAQDVRGALRTSEIKPGRTMRWLGRGLRRPRGDED